MIGDKIFRKADGPDVHWDRREPILETSAGRREMRALGITLLFVSVFAGAAGIVTAIWLGVAPEYTASAVLEPRPFPKSAFDPFPAVTSKDQRDAMATYYSKSVVNDYDLYVALSSSTVRCTNWFKNSPSDALERLKDDLVCYPEPGTGNVILSMTGASKEELPDIVSQVAFVATESARDSANRHAQKLARQVHAEKERLARDLDTIRANEDDFYDLLGKRDLLKIELQSLSSQIVACEAELKYAKDDYDRIRQSFQEGELNSIVNISEIEDQDPMICALLIKQAERFANEIAERSVKKSGPSQDQAKAVSLPPDPAKSRTQSSARSSDGKSQRWIYNSKGFWIRVPSGHDEKAPVQSGLPSGKKPQGLPPLPDTGKPPQEIDDKFPLDESNASRAIRLSIAERRDHVMKTAVRGKFADAESRITRARDRLDFLRQSRQIAEASLSSVRTRLKPFQLSLRKEKALTDQISDLDRRLAEMQLILSLHKPLELREQASEPSEPSFPKWSFMIPAGAGAGLVLGLLTSAILWLARKRHTAPLFSA